MNELSESLLGFNRLTLGPWQAFERDIARLLVLNGFEDVRLIGGPGDRGADILAVKSGQLWVVQCKHRSRSSISTATVQEIINAGKAYSADRLVVAASAPATQGFSDEVSRQAKHGRKIETLFPDEIFRRVERSPEYSRHRRSLRPYQDRIISALYSALLESGRGQVVMATGLGKTVVMAELLADLYRNNEVAGGRTLVLAHTRTLVEQLHKQFWYQLPKSIPTHQFSDGERPSFWDGITFATIQSVVANLDTVPDFGAVFIDEAHHVGASSFQQVIEALKPPKLIGVTATPWRGDRFELDHLLGPPVEKMGISDGLKNGHLSPVDYRLMADNINWEFIQERSRHSYSLTQLNRKLIIPTRDQEAGRLIAECMRGEKRTGGILYSPTMHHARHMAAVLRRFGLISEAITSDIHPREQDSVMARFKAGRIHIVCTVDMFNEGVDVPDVDLIVFMRVTHSRRIFVQQLGRGLRLSPGKDRVIVLDFVTDLRRVAEVVELDRAAQGGPYERLAGAGGLIRFRDASAGDFLIEWMLDQASLLESADDPVLELPKIEFPDTGISGNVE